MKFTVKMNRKEYTLTENDRILFNGSLYILITQNVWCGFSQGCPTVPKEYAEKWIKEGILVVGEDYTSFGVTYPLYKFVKEVE